MSKVHGPVNANTDIGTILQIHPAQANADSPNLLREFITNLPNVDLNLKCRPDA